MNKIMRIIICTALLILGLCLSFPNGEVLLLIAYLVIGYDIIIKAFQKLFIGKILDENFLMTIATFGAFATASYSEAVLVMLLYQIGEMFQDYATDKSKKSITQLMDIRPDSANLWKNGKSIKVPLEEIKVNDTIIIKPGERVPVDGIVIEGSSALDTKALTGESVPRSIHEKDPIISGCINLNGNLVAQVTKKSEESTVSKILELVSNATETKASTEKFITKFARYYTPIVVLLALLLSILPPLITDITFQESLYRAMTFLVVSCPCALVISIPLGFFGGIGGASRQGILIKGSQSLEAFSQVETMVFDKTGTLTEGSFEVVNIQAKGISNQQLLELATLAEYHSNHPIALSLKRAYKGKIDTKRIKKIEEIAGKGIKGEIDGKEILVGNIELLKESGIEVTEKLVPRTIIYVSYQHTFIGYIEIADQMKKNAKKAVQELKEKGNIKTMVMLTGDDPKVAADIAKKLEISQYHASLLPHDKVTKLKEIIMQNNKKVAFVGDGINDAPVLAIADVGIAMGSLGSDAAIEAADIVIMDDNLSKIAHAKKISQKTIRIVKENIVFSLAVKAIVLCLGALGLASMKGAVFADVGVSVLAILNSMRALSSKGIGDKNE